MLVAGGHEKVLRSRSSWIAGDTVGRGGHWTAYLRSLEAFGPQDMLELRTSQEPLHNSNKDGAGEGYFLPSLATDFLPHVARAERPWRSGGLYYGYPAATWPPLEVGTGKSLRPTVAPPPSWARGGGTGRLRRPKLGSVPGGLLGDAQGWETSGKTKIQDKEHTVAREWVGKHRPTGRGVKGAGAPSSKDAGRRPGKPDVGSGRAGFRVTSTCREGPVFTKWSSWALTSRQTKIWPK